MLVKAQSNLRAFYEKYDLVLACIILFSIPLKLSYVYIPLIPGLVIWLFACPERVVSAFSRARPIFLPLVVFLCFTLYISLFGIDPLESLPKTFRMLFYALCIPFFLDAAKRMPILPLICLFLSSSIAAFYAVLRSSFPDQVGRIFHGTVSHSGQIGIYLIVLIGFIAFAEKLSKQEVRPITWLYSATLSVALLLLGFGDSFLIPEYLRHTAAFLLMLWFCWQTWIFFKASNYTVALYNWLLLVCLPLTFSALLVNLKRGPWLGIVVGLSIYFLVRKPIRILYVLAIAIALFLLIEPINDRIVASHDHFNIAGGRNAIWEIGTDLAIRYPLGIGFDNSGFLQNFSHQIPKELNHFHNNFINILVETGWLGLLMFLWWLITIISWGFKWRNHPIFGSVILACSCGFLSWQIAGLVEYNFGDSEVYLLVLALAGLMLVFSESECS